MISMVNNTGTIRCPIRHTCSEPTTAESSGSFWRIPTSAYRFLHCRVISATSKFTADMRGLTVILRLHSEMSSCCSREFLGGFRQPDSAWSWLVCASAAVANGLNFGFSLSFGVLFPVLMDYFKETRERTGERLIFRNSTVLLIVIL